MPTRSWHRPTTIFRTAWSPTSTPRWEAISWSPSPTTTSATSIRTATVRTTSTIPAAFPPTSRAPTPAAKPTVSAARRTTRPSAMPGCSWRTPTASRTPTRRSSRRRRPRPSSAWPSPIRTCSATWAACPSWTMPWIPPRRCIIRATPSRRPWTSS